MLSTPFTPLQIGGAVYVIAGLLVKGIVAIRGMKFRRDTLPGGPLWDARDNSRNTLFVLLAATDWNLIGILFQILLWPIWVVWLVLSTGRIQKFFEHDDSFPK